MNSAAPSKVTSSAEIDCPECRASWVALLSTPARGSFHRCKACRAADPQLSFLEWGWHREERAPLHVVGDEPGETIGDVLTRACEARS